MSPCSFIPTSFHSLMSSLVISLITHDIPTLRLSFPTFSNPLCDSFNPYICPPLYSPFPKPIPVSFHPSLPLIPASFYPVRPPCVLPASFLRVLWRVREGHCNTLARSKCAAGRNPLSLPRGRNPLSSSGGKEPLFLVWG